MARESLRSLSLLALKRAARSKMGSTVYTETVEAFADGPTSRANVSAFERLVLWPRVLRGVASPILGTRVLGDEIPLPMLLAPVAFQRLVHPDGELAVARASKRAGVPMVVGTFSTTALEEVCKVGGQVWLELSLPDDRTVAAEMVQRATAAGCRAIVLAPHPVRLGSLVSAPFSHEPSQPPIIFGGSGALGDRNLHKTNAAGLTSQRLFNQKEGISWGDVEWLLSQSSLPLLLKGVMHPEDARKAVDVGVKGLIVSNYDARGLGIVPASLDALPRIVEAVEGRAEVILGGGVRSGGDVVKAVALGANAVLVSRPVLWGLAVEGQRGVERVIDMLRSELKAAMVLCGCANIEQINKDLIYPQS